MKTYHVYILASHSRTLYIGMTSDLEGLIYEHNHGLTGGFTARYRVNRLVYVEDFNSPDAAIAREKQLKGWRRSKKIALIESANPGWHDLSDWWFADERLDDTPSSCPLEDSHNPRSGSS